MHLVSRGPRRSRCGRRLRFRLEDGETIWTESSYKYEPEGIRQLIEPRDSCSGISGIDDRARFALTLFEVI
jgi:uncharacterized SAM-dependent methyltransferase